MSANALLKAVVERLLATPAIVAITGPDRVYDRQISRVHPPYLVLGEVSVNDWSTGDSPGSEHLFDIEAWCRANGRKQANELAQAIHDALHEADLTLDGAVLVNLRHQRTVSRRAPKSHSHVARLRFRAVTEP